MKEVLERVLDVERLERVPVELAGLGGVGRGVVQLVGVQHRVEVVVRKDLALPEAVTILRRTEQTHQTIPTVLLDCVGL